MTRRQALLSAANVPDAELLTLTEVKEVFRVSERTVFRWLSEGLLPVVRVGKITRVRRCDLQAFIEAHLVNEQDEDGVALVR